MQNKLKKIFSNKIIAALTIVLSIAIIVTSGLTLAKYRYEKKQQSNILAETFHVSSDYLEENSGSIYAVSNWKNGINLLLFNYEKENEGLIATTDIKYTITVPDKFRVEVTSEDGINQLPKNNVYTIVLETTKTYHQVKVLPKSGEIIEPDTVIDITITTTSPFKKVLTGKFKLTYEQDIEYTVDHITNNGDYYLVTIYTNQYSGDVEVTWPSNLVPDTTNDLMTNWLTSGYFSATKLSTYKLIFFNPEGSSYTMNDFNVTEKA